MKVALLKPFDIMEIHNALRALSLTSCLREDEITAHFFLKYWEYIGEDLTKAYQRIFDTRCIPRSTIVGLIDLIPKSEGISNNIWKCRLIILLDTKYNFFAKNIIIEIATFVRWFDSVSQIGFIQERSIMDNLFFFGEVNALASNKKEDSTILLLDYKNAYDRVDGGFLHGTLVRLCFLEGFFEYSTKLGRQIIGSK